MGLLPPWGRIENPVSLLFEQIHPLMLVVTCASRWAVAESIAAHITGRHAAITAAFSASWCIIMGSPIKELVKQKHTPPSEKMKKFFL